MRPVKGIGPFWSTNFPTKKTQMRRALLSLLLVAFLASCGPAAAQPSTPISGPDVTPGLCRIRTDMELAEVNSIPTGFHSRTRLPDYSHVFDGVTPATMRLQGGRGFLQLPKAWQDYVARINGNNAVVLKYLFHGNSGWQNSDQEAVIEQLAFQDQWLRVLKVSGSKAYVDTFFSDQAPPPEPLKNDPRQQLFTIVTRDDRMIGSPKGDAYIILIARPGEALWIPTGYLACPVRTPGMPIFP